MKTIIEESIEQLKGHTPPPRKPLNAKDQLNPGTAFKEVLKQTLGYDGKSVPSKDDVQKMQEKERASASEEQKKVLDQIEKEKKNQSKIKPNYSIITPPKPESNKPPEYISGKADYNPEKQQKAKMEAMKLPELSEPSSKPRRGSFNEYMNRKKKGAEIKSGPSG
ncbi:MAG: hypothetical protein M1426_02540 [Patescibacteria group bacterium]|nr:hypothetical protein [Patescibacteria group bacterium]